MSFTKNFKKINTDSPSGYQTGDFFKINEGKEDDDDSPVNSDSEFEFNQDSESDSEETIGESDVESLAFSSDQSDTESENKRPIKKKLKKNTTNEKQVYAVVLQEEEDFVEEKELIFFSVNSIKH
jgi:hypothetical protein